MSLASRIMAERSRLIQNADEVFAKKLEEMLCKPKQKPLKESSTGTIILLVAAAFAFVLLIIALSSALSSQSGAGQNLVYYNTLPSPAKSLVPTTINTTIIQPVQEVIKERVIIGSDRQCYKLETMNGITYVCET